MCTAFSTTPADHYFGRNLDLDYHYKEEVTITPRAFCFSFRHTQQPKSQYAMIGVATVIDGYPLYYEAVNEKGLCMAGLNFPGNADYKPVDPGKVNIASFELIPWILSQCETVENAKDLLNEICICNTPFRQDLPPTPLHWLLSDRQTSIVIESMPDGLKIYDNPVGVLTNNPPFPFHWHNLANYMNLTPTQPTNRFSNKLALKPYSLGLGGFGLPGDFSSASRFIRCAYIKENSIFGKDEMDMVSQVFHILDSVSQFDGCVQTAQGYEKTLYSICCNATKGVFYWTTYSNRQISAVNMHACDLNGTKLYTYPLFIKQQINHLN